MVEALNQNILLENHHQHHGDHREKALQDQGRQLQLQRLGETKKCGQCERAMQGPYLDGSTPDAPKLMIGVQNVPADTEIEFNVTFKNALEAQECLHKLSLVSSISQLRL